MNRTTTFIAIVAATVCSLFHLVARADETPPAIRLEPIVRGLESLTYLTNDGTPSRLFVCEQVGRVRLIENGKLVKQPCLDISKEVWFQGECGFLSIAFHPDYKKNGLVYAYYINNASANGAPSPGGRKVKSGGDYWAIISEFHADPATGKFDPASERQLLKFDERPYGNHKGGQLQFGPDGYLYLGTGDGGLHDDPRNNAQNLLSPLGKIHRIDVNKRDGDKPYGIPSDNPFVGNPQAMPEIFCYGMRNPWRFSFDPVTNEIYCGDVGQDKYEEIDLLVKGGNYGWRGREGFHPNPTLKRTFPPGVQDIPGAIDPILEYPHTVADNNKSITGGYVYRGKSFPALTGWYIYGDYSSGRIWGLKQKDGKVLTNAELLHSKTQPSSFGLDSDGEIYNVDYNGGIFKIVPAAASDGKTASNSHP
jgi:glucose/arabinose dehydrogenase